MGVSSVYLTQLFKRALGLPLHQYLMGLRLNEALFALRDAPDLTALALDFGFSSHSHFTAAFRTRFGVTPSRVRQQYASDLFMTGPAPMLPQRPLCAARGGSLADELDWQDRVEFGSGD